MKMLRLHACNLTTVNAGLHYCMTTAINFTVVSNKLLKVKTHSPTNKTYYAKFIRRFNDS